MFGWFGKKVGGIAGEKAGEWYGSRHGEQTGREAYEQKGFFGRLFTNEERFINQHREQQQREWGERGKEIGGFAGKWTARHMTGGIDFPDID